MLSGDIRQLIAESFSDVTFSNFLSDEGVFEHVDFLGDKVTESNFIYEMLHYSAIDESAFQDYKKSSNEIPLYSLVAGTTIVDQQKVKDFFNNSGVSVDEAEELSTIFVEAMSDIPGDNPVITKSMPEFEKAIETGNTQQMNSLFSRMTSSISDNLANSGEKVKQATSSAGNKIADETGKFVEFTSSQLSKFKNFTTGVFKTSADQLVNKVNAFFEKYAGNIVVDKLKALSISHPGVFYSLLISLPVIAAGGATYLVVKAIRSRADAKKAIDIREKELLTTTDSKKRAKLQGEIGAIGAKGLVLSK